MGHLNSQKPLLPSDSKKCVCAYVAKRIVIGHNGTLLCKTCVADSNISAQQCAISTLPWRKIADCNIRTKMPSWRTWCTRKALRVQQVARQSTLHWGLRFLQNLPGVHEVQCTCSAHRGAKDVGQNHTS